MVVAIVLAVCGAVLGFIFAGSPDRIAAGVKVDGVNVGGLTAGEARTKLERRASALAEVPVTFTAGGHEWQLKPVSLGVEADWGAAAKLALDQGDGVGPIRGFRRIGVRVFGADVAPPTRVLERALVFEVGRMAKAVNRPHRDAAIVLHGLQPVVLGARTGVALDRAAAGDTIVRSLASFQRGHRVALPVRVDAPKARAGDLTPVAAQVRTALARPVRMQLGAASWWLPQRQLAAILQLPRGGTKTLAVGGPGATRYFARLGRGIDKPARDATFSVLSSGRVVVVPARPGRVVAAGPTGRHILAAALAPQARTARVVVTYAQPHRSTAQAKAMGITTRVAGYETIYGGDPNRIHNVQLVAQLIDGKLIAPGATFSFNAATGDRTADKGFREAPVIINGELTTGLGGGVCQVSTTVFNAAYEAGLKITERTNHALYISHYPQGRDATVNYPDVDLKFVNDTAHWLLLRTFVGSYSLAGRALRGAAEPARRERDAAARHDRARAAREGARPGALRRRRPPSRRAGAAPQSTSVAAQGLHRRRRAALRQHLVLVLPRRDAHRPRRDEAEAGRAAEEETGADRTERPDRADGPTGVSCSAALISSASQPGTRVGR